MLQLEFNFLIKPPQLQEPQSYKVKVQLASPVVTLKEIYEKAPAALIALIGEPLGSISITYVDYVIARTILSAIDEWLAGLREIRKPKFVYFFSKRNQLIERTTKYILLLAVATAAIRILPPYLGKHPSLSDFGIFMICTYIALLVAYRSGLYLGENIQKAIQSILPVAGIKINVGSQRLMEKVAQENKDSRTRALRDLFFELALAITAHVAAGWILH